MKLRYFILSVLLFSYGTLLGHELVYGHHTNAEVTYHHNNSGCCEDHTQSHSHLPCVIDINPHFVASSLTLDHWFDNEVSGNIDYYAGEHAGLKVLSEPEMEVPPKLIIYCLYAISINRSQGLRGPPRAV
jgi:hypothetical protein